jgi:hypothetical protein
MSTILPLDLPDSRIFTFGYDASVVDWRSVVSQSRVGNHATNLLNAVATHRENDGTVSCCNGDARISTYMRRQSDRSSS